MGASGLDIGCSSRLPENIESVLWLVYRPTLFKRLDLLAIGDAEPATSLLSDQQ
jgi:hypothetical protein